MDVEIDAQPNISSRLHVIGLWVAIQLYVEEIGKGNVTGNAKTCSPHISHTKDGNSAVKANTQPVHVTEEA